MDKRNSKIYELATFSSLFMGIVGWHLIINLGFVAVEELLLRSISAAALFTGVMAIDIRKKDANKVRRLIFVFVALNMLLTSLFLAISAVSPPKRSL